MIEASKLLEQNLKYLESETKIDRVRILIWLNENYLENPVEVNDNQLNSAISYFN